MNTEKDDIISLCANCGEELKEAQNFCPKCGQKASTEFVQTNMEEKKNKPFYKKRLVILIIVILIGIIIAVGSSRTDGDSLYQDKFTEQTELWSEALHNLGLLLENPKIGEDEWLSDVAVSIEMMKSLSSQAKGLKPPKIYKEVHDLYLEGVEDLEWVADNLLRGIYNLDSDITRESFNRLDSATVSVSKAIEKFNEIE